MRKLQGIYKWAVFGVGIFMVLYTIMSVTFITSDPWIFRATHLTLALIMVFFLVPAVKSEQTKQQTRPQVIDFVFAAASIAILVYLHIEFSDLIYRAGSLPTQMDIVFGLMLIVLILEASRRTAGMAFTVVALIALIYPFIGPYLPGLLGHKGYSLGRTVSFIFSTEGVYGSTLRASASFAILFITLGAFFKAFGAADFFNDFSMAISGHTRGGPGKVAVLASALFGTISGHAAGNVATTGSFTIPMMKKIGYHPAFAGAVEAAASAGGQILPPVMGTVVFVMIELTGINYSSLIIAASIPAILYFLAIFFMVDFEAVNLNLLGLPKDQLPSVKGSLKQGLVFLVSISVLLFFLFVRKSSVTLAAVNTIVAVILLGLLKDRNLKVSFKKILDGLYSGATGTMKLAPLTASAGIVIGVVTLTGIGVKLGRFLISISGGELFFVLFFAMILSLILGMGMSTIPAYVIAAAVVAPALIQIGIPILPAHLFVLYYACISTITPPIAISSFTAAGIADSDPMETGWKAVKLAIVGFIVPFIFVYRPALLAQGDLSVILYSSLLALIAIYSLSRGLQLRASWIERFLLVVGSGLLLFPINDQYGAVLLVIGYGIHFFKKYKQKKARLAT